MERRTTPPAVILTREMIIAGRSEAGGWTRRQLALIGVDWPPQRGWLDDIGAHEPIIEKAKYEEFLRLKDAKSRDK